MERPGVGMNFPVVEMSSQSKLSSIAWNPYVKNHLASSDYDGMVHIWDVSTQKPTKAYDEHSKRVWSVGFSPADPMRLISGSDDGLVKVWSMLQDSSVMTINSHANVCCVQFNPLDPHQIALLRGLQAVLLRPAQAKRPTVRDGGSQQGRELRVIC